MDEILIRMSSADYEVISVITSFTITLIFSLLDFIFLGFLYKQYENGYRTCCYENNIDYKAIVEKRKLECKENRNKLLAKIKRFFKRDAK